MTPRASLRPALVRGAAWTAGATYGASLLNIGVALALTRLLIPSDFGIQSAVITITAFFGTLADTGVGSAVVQREDLTQDELSSIFWSSLVASVAVYLLVLAGTPLVGRAFASPALLVVLPVAALSIVVFGGAIVPNALLRRRLAFGTLARAQMGGALAGACVAVATALAGGHYWALIGYTLTSHVVRAVLVFAACGWHPSLVLRASHLKKVRHYAGSMVSFVSVNYWSRNLDNILIGRFLGIGALGFYSLAYRLIGAPLQLLTGSLAPLLHPTFAAMGDDVPRQRAAYLDLARVTALLTMPVGAMLWVLSDPLVHVLAGPAWMPSAAVVRALAPLAAIQPVNMLCGSVFMARDAAQVMLRCAIIGAVAVTIGMLVGLQHGVAGVAWGYSLAYALVAAPVSTFTAFRLVGGTPMALVRALARPVMLGLVVLAGGVVLTRALTGVLGPAQLLALLLVACVASLAAIGAPTARRLLAVSGARRSVA